MAAQGLKVWETTFTLSTDINSLCEFSVLIWSLMFSFSVAFYTELTILLMAYYFPRQIPGWLNYNTDSYLQGALSFCTRGCLGTLSNRLHRAAAHWAAQRFCLPLRRIRQFETCTLALSKEAFEWIHDNALNKRLSRIFHLPILFRSGAGFLCVTLLYLTNPNRNINYWIRL